MVAQLRVVRGPDSGRVITVRPGQRLLFGRDRTSDVQMTDPQVARVHCRVWIDDKGVWVSDCGSTSGTLINGERAAGECLLNVGDALQIGLTGLELTHFDPTAVPRAKPSPTRMPTPGLSRIAEPAEPDAVEDQHALTPKPKPGAAAEFTDRQLRYIELEAKNVLIANVLGRQIGPYEVLEETGQDDTGAVFRARDVQDGRVVRFKVLWSKIAADDTMFARFVRAMRTTIDLDHPNLVKIYSAGKEGEYCFFTTEVVEGQSLDEIIKTSGGTLEWQSVARIGIDVARALELAYERKIVHRNIKPANVLCTISGVTKLDNLLLAKATEGAMAQTITVQGSGEVIGDMVYVSPECNIGDPSDHRSDIYSLGATLYEALVGQPPFGAPSIIELARQIEQQPPAPTRAHRPEIPEPFDAVIMKMLAKRPEDRYQSPVELRGALKEVLDSH